MLLTTADAALHHGRIFGVVLVVLSFAYCGLAQQQNGGSILRIPRVATSPSLDNLISGDVDGIGARISGFRQFQPGDGAAASQETTAFVSYDQKNLYILFVCNDDPSKIRSRLSKREDVELDDTVGVDLDTFNDRQHYYQFLVNARGVQQDSLVTEGYEPDTTFDTLWWSDAHLTATGFVAKLVIPFNSLRFSSARGQRWRIALERRMRTNDELAYWPYITQRVAGIAQQFAIVEGLEEISSGRNVQLIPYFFASRNRSFDPTQSPAAVRFDSEARAGLDSKLVLHNAFSLDVTVNPDFSQVESDEPQVTVNQRYEVYFPEKRPFFLENGAYFQTPINLLFSRRIADPQAGLRLTGQERGWAVGVLAMDDRSPGRQVAVSDSRYGDRAVVTAFRLRRNLHEQSNLGLLITTRHFGSNSNRVFSLDTRLKLNAQWVLTGQAARSDGGEKQSGHAYWAELSRSGRNVGYTGSYQDYSPDFVSDLGFVPRVDLRSTQHYVWYMWTPENSRIVRSGPDAQITLNWNSRGKLQDWIFRTSAGADLRGPWRLGCSYTDASELFVLNFRHHRTDCGISTASLRWLNISTEYAWGTSINYTPPVGMPPFLATSTTTKAALTLFPTSKMRLTATYLYSRLGGFENESHRTSGLAVLNNHLARGKLNYQFTRPLSVRLIVDYNGIIANRARVNTDPIKRLTADVLVTYLLHPGTALYVGYTDTYENLALNDTAPFRCGSPTLPTGRQVFAKVSYLFRF